MTLPRPARPLREGGAAVACGAGLFAAAAAIERAAGSGVAVSAVLEECGKALLLLVWGFYGWESAARGGAPTLSRARRRRELLLGEARGLSLGLVSIAVFVAAENLAYFAAFPEAGILTRLAWAVPVHLVAALLEAVGALLFLRALTLWAQRTEARSWLGPALGCLAWLASLGGGAAWHTAANLLVERGLDTKSLVAGSLAGSTLAVLLFALFLRRAYIGGFLHGAD